MQFKHKLIYFALGCAFVVIAQVLLSVVVPKVTAQGEKESVNLAERIRAQGKKETVEFDTVKVRCLQVVDDEGKVRVQLEVTKRESVNPMDDVIQLFSDGGVPICKAGSKADSGFIEVLGENSFIEVLGENSSVSSRGNKIFPAASLSKSGVTIMGEGNSGASLSVSSEGGSVYLRGQNGYANMSASEGGSVGLCDKVGNVGALIMADADGGIAEFCGKNNKKYAAIRPFVGGPFVGGGGVYVLGDTGKAALFSDIFMFVGGNDDKPRVVMGVNEDGHGIVQTGDKDGVVTDVLGGVASSKSTSSSSTPRFPSSTTQRKEVYPGVSGGHWVSKVMESGKYVMLEDKSLWEVSPLDRTNSMLWLVTEKITILENKDGIYILSYPYKLINSDSKNTVEAKYLGK